MWSAGSGNCRGALKDGTYAPQAVRQVLIPKKQPGQFRPLGIPTIRGPGGPDIGPACAGADL